jgi:hypothetical protein
LSLFLFVISWLHETLFIMSDVCYYFTFNFAFQISHQLPKEVVFFRIQLPIILTYYSYKIIIFAFDESTKQSCVNFMRSFLTLFHMTASIIQHILWSFCSWISINSFRKFSQYLNTWFSIVLEEVCYIHAYFSFQFATILFLILLLYLQNTSVIFGTMHFLHYHYFFNLYFDTLPLSLFILTHSNLVSNSY